MAGSSTLTWSKNLTLTSAVSPFDSPLPGTHTAFKGVKPVSWKRYNVSGMLVTVYGLQELPAEPGEVACFYLLHGRGDTQDSMAFVAAAFLDAWSRKRKHGQRHLICVCLDQRNHGSRMVHYNSNESWKAGNATHGPDMFNTYSGSAQDVSTLITHLPSYLPFVPVMNICGGVRILLSRTLSTHPLIKNPMDAAAVAARVLTEHDEKESCSRLLVDVESFEIFLFDARTPSFSC